MKASTTNTSATKTLGNYLKIIPLLVGVAMLSFAVRLADVTSEFSAFSGSVHAMEDPPGEEGLSLPGEHTEASHNGDSDKQPVEEMKMAQADTEAEDSVLDTPINVDGPDETRWRDPGNEAPGYSEVKQEVWEDLSKRRQVLDKREKELRTREALLKAAEQELEQKYQELTQLRGEIETLLGKQSEEEKARITSLVKIYEGMKPKDAARIFDTLDIDVLVTVMGQMSERRLSPILAAMDPERARTMTIMLAEQKKLPSLPEVD